MSSTIIYFFLASFFRTLFVVRELAPLDKSSFNVNLQTVHTHELLYIVSISRTIPEPIRACLNGYIIPTLPAIYKLGVNLFKRPGCMRLYKKEFVFTFKHAIL